MKEVTILLTWPLLISLPTPKSSKTAVREIIVRSLISGLETKASIKFSATPQTPNPPMRIEDPDLIPESASVGPGTCLSKALTISSFCFCAMREKCITGICLTMVLSISRKKKTKIYLFFFFLGVFNLILFLKAEKKKDIFLFLFTFIYPSHPITIQINKLYNILYIIIN